jgi:MYXO-CTERM domain-containing protein
MRSTLLALALALIPALAAADIPPPDGYKESCTLEAYAKDGRECATCSAWHGGHEQCDPLEAKGMTSQCKTYGASAWSEVWCGPAPAPKDPPPATQTPKGARGCGCSTGAAGGAAGGAVALLLGLALVLRRR